MTYEARLLQWIRYYRAKGQYQLADYIQRRMDEMRERATCP